MPNRLIHEKSPYLLQHAHNPVDWYPWGEEALATAREHDKPIFLSIGYSTCHWCHVMERESFEDPAIAEVLNSLFIPVKVDREERPDLDRIYMLFVQASTGSGGWPMSVWLTPQGRPFFGGTYFAPDNRYGRPGFRVILESLARAWKEDREKIESSGTQVIEQLKSFGGLDGNRGDAGRAAWDRAYNYFRRTFDARLGGFGGAPKFPRPSVHNFLLRYYQATGTEDARDMVLKTLDEMAKGGMNDQLGGGFHRYSVDERWFVPHFEKMLYDQAQLAISYLEAFQITGEERYAASARDIFEYVLRDLTDPLGGFYSAEDADSVIDPALPHEKAEGAFYVWSYEEIVNVLGTEEADVFCKRFGVEPGGNVEHDPHNEFGGKNILYQARDVADPVDESIAKLLAIRNTRPRPHLDDKILTSWNALMISAFSKGAQVLGEPRYAKAAREAQLFIFTRLWRAENKTLLRRHREGESVIEGFLDDYAFLINALLDLYETDFDAADLAWAEELAARAIELFEDKEHGGFFSTAAGKDDLILRLKDDYDGAEPSGNSMMILGLLRLARMKSREDLWNVAGRALGLFGPKLIEAGAGLPQMLAADLFAHGKPMEIVLAGPRDGLDPMLAEVRKRFLPEAVILLGEHAPDPMPAIGGAPTAYVCENYTCQLPATSAAELVQRLQ